MSFLELVNIARLKKKPLLKTRLIIKLQWQASIREERQAWIQKVEKSKKSHLSIMRRKEQRIQKKIPVHF